MPRLLLCAAIVALLAACAEGAAPLTLYDPAARDAQACAAAGYTPNSEPYQACVARAAYYRDAQRQYRSLSAPGVRCMAGSNAGGCF